MSLKSRLKLFASSVTPTIMFGLKSCPCTVRHLKQIDAVQRKMLRIVVGWIRVPGEDWAETMRRMRDRVQRALDISKMQDWSKLLVGLKYRLAHVVARCPHSWAHAAATWIPRDSHIEAKRFAGRPARRWDDDLLSFSAETFGKHWIDAAASASEWLPKQPEFFAYSNSQ